MPDDPYAEMESDDEYRYILEILAETSGPSLLAVPGVLEVLREEWNNEVLERWDRDHPREQDEEEEDDAESNVPTDDQVSG